MLRSNPDGLSIRIIGTERFKGSLERLLVHQCYETPYPDEPGYISSIVEICEAERIDAIFAGCEPDARALSLHRREIESHGASLVMSDHAIIERAADKVAFMESVATLGLPVAGWRLVDSHDSLRAGALSLGYPEREVALKPRGLAGRKGFWILSSAPRDATRFFLTRDKEERISLPEVEALYEALPSPPDLLLMEYLPGLEYSVDAFRGQEVAVAIPRERLKTQGGLSIHTRLADRPDLAEATVKIAEALGLTSLFGIQFRLDADGVPKVLECNPRIQASIGLSLLSGANLAWMALQEALGDRAVRPPSLSTKGELRWIWRGLIEGERGSAAF